MQLPEYFDCYAALGRFAGKDPLGPWTLESMLAEMARCRISGALVYSHQAAEVHPEVGNPLISEICAAHASLLPCWVGLPHQTGEVPAPAEFLQRMEDENVRAVKLFPRTYQFGVDKETIGELLGLLEDSGRLVIFDRGEYPPAVQIDWQEIAWVCEQYPRLPVLLHTVRWESTRRLVPLADRFANLHFEFSNYQGNRMLEYFVDRIGAERLLFGTEAMKKSIGAARAYVDYAELTPKARAAIAGGNLRRLLRHDGPLDAADAPPPADAILKEALQGNPIRDMHVIDAHAHLVQEGGRGAAMVAMNLADGRGVVERNRLLGVRQTCVSAWTAIWSDYKLGNEDTAAAMRAFPGEIVGFAALDPNYVTDWAAECRYYYEELGFKGMKPYWPRMGAPYNDPRYDAWWEYGNRQRLFALMHPSDNFKAEMEDLAARFPEITFLLAHSGWTWQVAQEHVELAKRFPNCMLEITFTAVTNGSIEYMVQEVGSERVLYGSDAPMRDPAPQFGWVVYADIGEEEKRNILGRNMEQIIKRVRV